MKITDVKAMTLKGYKQWNYVQVETDDGLTGIGEAHPGAGIAEIILQFKKTLVGADPRNIEPLYHRMIGAASNRYAMGLSAIGGIETALWDLLGKALACRSISCWVENIGTVSDSMPMSGMERETHLKDGHSEPEKAWQMATKRSSLISTTPQTNSNRMRSNRELSTAELQKMTSLVAAAREAAGDGIDISIDCHSLFSTHSAMKLAERLEPFDLMFLEDPVPNDNVEAMAKVSAATSIPICTGEFLFRRDGFRELIQTQACDMLHVDVSGTGGMLEAKKIADLADLYYIPFAAHNITSPIGMTATAHVCAAVRNFIVMELPYHADQVEWRWDLAISSGPLMQDNAFVVPEQPGLGVEINAEVAREHLMPGSDHFGVS